MKTKSSKKQKSGHTTSKICIKPKVEAHVDDGMIEMVNWINSHPSAVTQYCCHGEYTEASIYEDIDIVDWPYICFTCPSEIDLVDIIGTLDNFYNDLREDDLYYYSHSPTVDYNFGNIRYCIRFGNRNLLDKFIQYLQD